MKRHAFKCHLFLVCLLIFSGSVQAWTSLPASHTADTEVIMDLAMDHDEHCPSQSDADDTVSCQGGHCSMCVIGLSLQPPMGNHATSPPMLPTVALHSTSIAISELYRPPRALF